MANLTLKNKRLVRIEARRNGQISDADGADEGSGEPIGPISSAYRYPTEIVAAIHVSPGQGHGHGHGVFILATYPKGK